MQHDYEKMLFMHKFWETGLWSFESNPDTVKFFVRIYSVLMYNGPMCLTIETNSED